MVIWLSGDTFEWIFVSSSNKVSFQSLFRLKPRDQQVQVTKKLAVEPIDSRTAQKGWVYGLRKQKSMDVIDGKMAAPTFFTASEICGDAIMGPTFSYALL